MEKLLFESDGKNISENKKKIGRKLGVIFLIAGGIGFLLFGNMYSNFYRENRVYLQVLSLIGLADAIVGIFLIVKRKDNAKEAGYIAIYENHMEFYNKRSKKIVSLKKNEVYAVSKKTVYALLLETQNGDFICEIDKANKALQVINEWKKGDR